MNHITDLIKGYRISKTTSNMVLLKKIYVIDGDKVLLLALGVRGTYVAEKENNAQH